MNEIGLPCCISTAPMPLPLASASRTKGWEKSGSAYTGGVDINFLRLLKASSWRVVHTKEFFFRASKSGLQITP